MSTKFRHHQDGVRRVTSARPMSFSSYFRRSSKAASAPAASGPRFHGHNSENTSLDLTRIIPPKQFCWSMAGAQWITEAQTFYLISKKGKFIFMQIAFSNLSWPAQTTCQVTVRYYDPATKKEAQGWHMHSAASKMKVSHDKRSVQVKTINFQHQDQTDGTFEIKLDFEEEGKISITMTFSPVTDAFSIKDGNLHFGVDKLDGFINMKFLPFAKISGKLKLDGAEEEFDGHGICVHQFQGLKPYLSASQWNVFYFQGDQEEGLDKPPVSLFMTQITTPPNYDAVTFNLGSLFVNGKLAGVSVGNKIDCSNAERDPDSNYCIPGNFTYTWEGTTFSNEPFIVTCDTAPTCPCAKINVLDHLPFFLRKAIEAFVTRPFAYYWLDRGEVKMKIGDQESTVKGWIMQELSLINAT